MKTIKSIFVTILIMLAVKGCFYVKNSMSRMDAETSATSNAENYSDTSITDTSTDTPPILSEPSASSSDRQGYQRHVLSNGVSLAVPEGWYDLPRQEVATIRAVADKSYHDSDPSKETPFAANSSQDTQSHEAQARVSFLAKDFEEADLRTASAADLNGVCDELYNGWMQSPSSPKLIGRPQCSVINLNSKSALLTRYTRAGNVPGTTWTVSMMQFPLERGTAMITLSKKNGSEIADKTINSILSSIEFN